MPEQQVAMVQCHRIPGVEIDLNFHLVATDFLEGDERGIHCSSGFNKHPALHFRRQQPLQALKLTHCDGDP